MSGCAIDCQLKELVVSGVAAGHDLFVYFDLLGISRQSCQKASNVLFVNVTPELLSAQHLVKLCERGERKKQPPPV